MHFERFLRSKKAEGEETETGKALRSIVIGGLVVITIMGILFKSSGILLASEAGQETIVSFNAFVKAFNSVANQSKDIAIVNLMSVKHDQLIVVFDSNIFAESWCQRDAAFRKPQSCGNKVCICICEEDDKCKNPFECRVIEKTSYGIVIGEYGKDFNANLGKKYPGTNGAYVMIYGDCDGWDGEPLGIRDIVIEVDNSASNTIMVSDNACANLVVNGKIGRCEKKSCSKTRAPYPGYKCEEGSVCCI